MNTMLKIAVLTTSLIVMLIANIPFLPVHLVSDADAIFGVRRRAFATGVVVGASMSSARATSEQAAVSQQQTAAAQQQAAAAQQQAAAAQQQAAAAQQQAAMAGPPAAPAAAGKPLPLGTVVAALPGGCTSTPVGGVEYYYCGGNFYRAVFQGNTLVYVTAKP
jgi:biotin carboxyl carrier protein